MNRKKNEEKQYFLFFDAIAIGEGGDEMVLTVCTSSRIIAQSRFAPKKEGAHAITEHCIDILQGHHIATTQLTGVAVVDAIAHFTSARIAITIANVLGWSLGIPINFIHHHATCHEIAAALSQRTLREHFLTPNYNRSI